jgi:hypothetical protein
MRLVRSAGKIFEWKKFNAQFQTDIVYDEESWRMQG